MQALCARHHRTGLRPIVSMVANAARINVCMGFMGGLRLLILSLGEPMEVPPVNLCRRMGWRVDYHATGVAASVDGDDRGRFSQQAVQPRTAVEAVGAAAQGEAPLQRSSHYADHRQRQKQVDERRTDQRSRPLPTVTRASYPVPHALPFQRRPWSAPAAGRIPPWGREPRPIYRGRSCGSDRSPGHLWPRLPR